MSEYKFMNRRACCLCEETRKFAYESMHGKYGTDAKNNTPFVLVDDAEGYEQMNPLQKYDAKIRAIAQKAPIRIVEGELISGAATLGKAINHVIPAKSKEDEGFESSISHVTVGFDRALRMGINAVQREIEDSLGMDGDDELRQSLINAVEAMRIWHKRYLDATTGIVHGNLLRVPFEAPQTFHQAVQSLWFMFAYTRVMGNWSGIGRIDQILGEYLDRDLENGVISLDEAREILAHFFIKGCEWTEAENHPGSGDAQHYQNIILAGVDEFGNEVTNKVTYLVLDIIEELGISDYPITIRINENTDDGFIARAAQVVKLGGGVIAFYNEATVLKALTDYGYPLNIARKFANDGCWEVQIPGETSFGYMPFDGLQILLRKVLFIGEEANTPEFESFDALYADYKQKLGKTVDGIINDSENGLVDIDPATGKKSWKKHYKYSPDSVISLFEVSCAKKGMAYNSGGANYTVRSPHLGGAPDVANSLYAIKKLVYEEKRLSLGELCRILENNWEGSEPLRLYAKNRYTYYGNDNDEVDELYADILNSFADMVLAHSREAGYSVMFIPGISTFGRQIEWLGRRQAVPFGYKKGDILAGNASPTPGTDISGATGIIKSYCKADHSKQICGAALDIVLNQGSVSGDEGTQGVAALIKGFCKLGGYFLQMDVQDVDTLLAAREHPEDYKTLSVRVSGWNARFVTLSEHWQDMVIERTKTGM